MKRVWILLPSLALLGLLMLSGCVSISKVELVTPVGSVGVPVDTEFSWRFSKLPTVGEVRFYLSEWKTNVENRVDPVVLDLSQTSLRAGVDIPPLQWNTTYYWMVELVEKDAGGRVLAEYSSDIAQFTTTGEPAVTIVSPSGDTVGGTVQLEWSVDGVLPENATKTFEILLGESSGAMRTVKILDYHPSENYSEDVDVSAYDGEEIHMAVKLKESFLSGDVFSQISPSVDFEVDVFGNPVISPIYPGDGKMVSEVDPELMWTLSKLPDHYRFRVYVDTDRDNLDDGAKWIMESDTESAKLGDDEVPLEWNEFYYWKVELDRLDEFGNVVKRYYGGPWSFYTPLKPSLNLVRPVDVEVDATTTEFEWHISRDIGDGWYELYLGEHATDMNIRDLVEGVAGQQDFTTTLDLSDYGGKVLYWKIKAVDVINAGYSYEYESPIASFTVKP